MALVPPNRRETIEPETIIHRQRETIGMRQLTETIARLRSWLPALGTADRDSFDVADQRASGLHD